MDSWDDNNSKEFFNSARTTFDIFTDHAFAYLLYTQCIVLNSEHSYDTKQKHAAMSQSLFVFVLVFVPFLLQQNSPGLSLLVCAV